MRACRRAPAPATALSPRSHGNAKQLKKELKKYKPAQLKELLKWTHPHGGATSIYVACEFKHKEVVKMLLEAGARSDARSSAGDTAMHIASREGLEHIATMLLDLSGPEGLALNASNIAGEVHLRLISPCISPRSPPRALRQQVPPRLHQDTLARSTCRGCSAAAYGFFSLAVAVTTAT